MIIGLIWPNASKMLMRIFWNKQKIWQASHCVGHAQTANLLTQMEQHGQTLSEAIKSFYIGFWTRFLFSCRIDADRISSADFENPNNASYRNKAVLWDIAINRLKLFLTEQQVIE